MSSRWDQYFLKQALVHAQQSYDPNTRVGAVIVGADKEVRATGFNGLPRGIKDTAKRLTNRELKLQLVVHAEMNAVLNAARVGISTKDTCLYLICTDPSGEIWGGCPCVRCTVELIQAGIKEVVSPPFKTGPSKWKDSIEAAGAILEEAGVAYREVPFNG